jgi:hypothetical protein
VAVAGAATLAGAAAAGVAVAGAAASEVAAGFASPSDAMHKYLHLNKHLQQMQICQSKHIY